MNANLHTFDLYNDYPLPEWSSKPINPYLLDILRLIKFFLFFLSLVWK